MYAQLGDIVFSNALGFKSFTDSNAASVAEHAVIDGKPRLQKTGDDLRRISFTVALHIQFSNIEDQVNKLYEYKANGEILPCILGTGEYLGDFIVKDIKNEILQTKGDGTLIECELEIKLIESVTPRTKDNKGFAIASNTPVSVSSVTPVIPVAGQIATEITDCKNISKEVDSNLKTAASNPTTTRAKMKDTVQKLNNIEGKLKKSYEATAQVFLYINEAQNLRKKISVAQSRLSALREHCKVNDVESARDANVAFQDSIRTTSTFTSPFLKQYTLRKSV